MSQHNYYVYFITNWTGERLYIGVTNNLARRVYEHKTKAVKGFTNIYNCHKLVYFEHTTDVNAAIAREKQLKGFRREKKDKLVIGVNPDWKDLAEDWYEPQKASKLLKQGSLVASLPSG